MKLQSILASSVLSLGLTVALGLATASACPDKEKKEEAAQKADPNAKVATASFHVQNMHCSGCADHVKEALAKANGILNVDVKVADGRVTVTYDANKITAEKLAKLMTDAGYPAAAEA